MHSPGTLQLCLSAGVFSARVQRNALLSTANIPVTLQCHTKCLQARKVVATFQKQSTSATDGMSDSGFNSLVQKSSLITPIQSILQQREKDHSRAQHIYPSRYCFECLPSNHYCRCTGIYLTALAADETRSQHVCPSRKSL